MRARFTWKRRLIADLAKRAVLVNRQSYDRAGGVIGEDKMSIGSVDRQMDGIGSLGRLSVDEVQSAASSIDPKRADLALVAMDRVKKSSLLIDRQNRKD
jgi:hypothetical protein